MVCNYCGNPFHPDEKCLLQLTTGYGLTEGKKFFPSWYEIEMRYRDRNLSLELFERWIESLKFKEMKI